MKIQCKHRCLESIGNKTVDNVFSKYQSPGLILEELTLGCEYIVYGITFWDSVPRYYLSVDDESYPIGYPYIFFDIVDQRLSKYWQLRIDDKSRPLVSEFVFPEWANDKLFYEKLLDDNPECIEIYKKYKELMDNEFE